MSELKPSYVCFLSHAALPEDSALCPLWRDIAEQLFPQLDEQACAILVRRRPPPLPPAAGLGAGRSRVHGGAV